MTCFKVKANSPFRCNTCREQRQKQCSGLCKLLVIVQLVKLTVFAWNMHRLTVRNRLKAKQYSSSQNSIPELEGITRYLIPGRDGGEGSESLPYGITQCSPEITPAIQLKWTHSTKRQSDRPVLNLPTLEGWKAEFMHSYTMYKKQAYIPPVQGC